LDTAGRSETPEWVVSRTWLDHVPHMYESRHTRTVFAALPLDNVGRSVYEQVMSHTWMRHAEHMNKSRHARIILTTLSMHTVWRDLNDEYFMWHAWLGPVAHMNKSCDKHDWVLPHTWIGHAIHMTGSCRTHEWVTWYTWLGPVAHMNESRSNAPRSRRRQPCPLQACWSRPSRSQNWPAHRTFLFCFCVLGTLLNIHVYKNIRIRVHAYTYLQLLRAKMLSAPIAYGRTHSLVLLCSLLLPREQLLPHRPATNAHMRTCSRLLLHSLTLLHIYIYTHSYTCTYKHAFVVYVRKCSPLLLQFLTWMRQNLLSALSTWQQRLSTLTCAHLEHVLIYGSIFLNCSANMFHQNWYLYERTVSLSIDLRPCFCLSWKELLPK